MSTYAPCCAATAALAYDPGDADQATLDEHEAFQTRHPDTACAYGHFGCAVDRAGRCLDETLAASELGPDR